MNGGAIAVRAECDMTHIAATDAATSVQVWAALAAVQTERAELRWLHRSFAFATEAERLMFMRGMERAAVAEAAGKGWRL